MGQKQNVKKNENTSNVRVNFLKEIKPKIPHLHKLLTSIERSIIIKNNLPTPMFAIEMIPELEKLVCTDKMASLQFLISGGIIPDVGYKIFLERMCLKFRLESLAKDYRAEANRVERDFYNHIVRSYNRKFIELDATVPAIFAEIEQLKTSLDVSTKKLDNLLEEKLFKFLAITNINPNNRYETSLIFDPTNLNFDNFRL